MKFELIIDDCITPLDDETVYHAETTGSLIHPDTGYPVENYSHHVYPTSSHLRRSKMGEVVNDPLDGLTLGQLKLFAEQFGLSGVAEIDQESDS
jgi:hypothetical protein